MDFGLVPIVRYPSLGDFEKFGYNYLTEDDFKALLLPDAVSRNYMIQQNYIAIQKLINEFKNGSNKLLELLAS